MLALCAAVILVGVAQTTEPKRGPSDPLGISPEQATSLPPEKREYWKREVSSEQTAAAKPLPTSANPKHVIPTPPLPTPRPSKIIEHPQAFGEYVFINAWYGQIGDASVAVRAGERRGGGAVVMVERLSAYGEPLAASILDVPAASTSVRLASVSAEGELALIDDEGNRFDVSLSVSDASQTQGIAAVAACCAVALDTRTGEAGVQTTASAAVGSTLEVDVLASDDWGAFNSLQFEVVYDDTVLEPLPGAGGVDGNPDFDQVSLGAEWNCSLPVTSGTPDVEPLSGPGQGVAFLVCFTTSSAVDVSAGDRIARLSFRLAGGSSDLSFRNVILGRPDGTELGSCNPTSSVSLACAGAALESLP